MKLIIEDDEGKKTVIPIVRDEITIGRQDGNTIQLGDRNVSRRHARLVRQNGAMLIEDLGSYNGVRVNGERIAEPTKIKEGDLVEIGDFDLAIEGKAEPAQSGAQQMVARAGTPLTAPKSAPSVRQATIPPGQRITPPLGTPVAQPAAEDPAVAGATAIIRLSDLAGAPEVELRELPKNEMPRIVGLSGTVRGKEFYLMRTDVKFGRTGENDIVVDHQSVSRQHARFVLDADGWKVVDNKSANGVKVNGDEYHVAPVKPGDTLELGHLKFRFCGPGEKFSVSADKAEAEPKPGPRPTPAELLAGASHAAAAAPAAAPKKKSALGVVLGALVVVALLGGGAFVFLRNRSAAGGGEDAARQADALFKKHEYIGALDLYERALADSVDAPNRKRCAVEAKGQETYNDLQAALAANDADKAKALFDRCASDGTYWCRKAQEPAVADAVKAKVAGRHVDAARAAKTANNLSRCAAEAGAALAVDPANADAQSLSAACQPRPAAAAAVSPPAEKKEAAPPSPREREAKAKRLAKDALDKLVARDFKTAIVRAKAALAEKPSDEETIATAYRAAGYAFAHLNDRTNAVAYLDKYLPYCTSDCEQVKTFLGR